MSPLHLKRRPRDGLAQTPSSSVYTVTGLSDSMHSIVITNIPINNTGTMDIDYAIVNSSVNPTVNPSTSSTLNNYTVVSSDSNPHNSSNPNTGDTSNTIPSVTTPTMPDGSPVVAQGTTGPSLSSNALPSYSALGAASDTSTSSSPSKGAIGGAVAGALLGVALLGVLGWTLARRRRQSAMGEMMTQPSDYGSWRWPRPPSETGQRWGRGRDRSTVRTESFVGL